MSRTLGQFVAEEQIVPWLADAIAQIHKASGRGAKEAGKLVKLAVSCTSCTATKTCCWSMVVARLYEGVIIAAELRRTGRDTAVLRDELRARAEAMEAASPYAWRTPCLFLDERERCTIYGVRPTSCAGLYVYTPPALCTSSTPGSGDIKAYVAATEQAVATSLEEEFRQRLNLRMKVGRRYLGVLPRMVLVSLEAWDRADFRDYLRQLPWPDAAAMERWEPGNRPTG